MYFAQMKDGDLFKVKASPFNHKTTLKRKEKSFQVNLGK